MQRIQAKKGERNYQNLSEGQIFLFKCNVLLFSMQRLLNCMALFTLVSIFEWSFSWSLDCQATKKAINISRGHGSWPFSTSIASIQKLLKYRTVAHGLLLSSLEYMYCLEWFKNPVSSQTDKLMEGTKFSDYLGLNHFKKAKKIKHFIH